MRRPPDRSALPTYPELLLSSRGVPHLHVITACRRQPFPIRAKDHARDPVGVPFQRERLLTARGVPHFHRLIRAGRCQPFPVRAKCHATDRFAVPFQREQLLTARGVPHLHLTWHTRVVWTLTCRRQPLPIRA